MYSRSVLLPWCLLLLLYGRGVGADNPGQIFTSNQKIHDSFYDQYDSTIYVAVTNWIYVLNSTDLMILDKLKLGPIQEKRVCEKSELNCDILDVVVNDFIMVLAKVTSKVNVEESIKRRKLFICANSYSGSCAFYNRKTLKIYFHKAISGFLLEHKFRSTSILFYDEKCIYYVQTRDYIGHEKGRKIYAQYSIYPMVMQIYYNDTTIIDSQKIPVSLIVNLKVIALFPSDDHYYMVYVTSTREGLYPETRLARFCRDLDVVVKQWFRSYTDIPLTLVSGKVRYNRATSAHHVRAKGKVLNRLMNIPDIPPYTSVNDVLYISATSSATVKPDPNAESALFILKMSDLRTKFTHIITDCNNKIGKAGIPFYNPAGSIYYESDCIEIMGQSEKLIDNNRCLAANVLNPYVFINNKINSYNDFKSEAIMQFSMSENTPPDKKLSYATKLEILTADRDNNTVLVVGTYLGTVVKIIVNKRPFIYHRDSPSEGYPISHRSFTLDNHVYAISNFQISRTKIIDCERYTNCSSCVVDAAACGWCSDSQQCTEWKHCRQTDHLPWLTFENSSCAYISSITPSLAQILKNSNIKQYINVKVVHARLTSDKLECVFNRLTLNYDSDVNSITRYTNARVSTATKIQKNSLNNATIICKIPRSNLLPLIKSSKDHIILNVTLRSGNMSIIASNLTLYDCTIHKDCGACLSSKFKCNWCIRKHSCQPNIDKCSDLIENSKNIRIEDTCPHFAPFYENETTIYLPYGRTNQLRVRLVNIKDYMNNFQFRVSYNKNKYFAPKIVNGTLLSDIDINFNAEKSRIEFKVQFDISGRTYTLDNYYNMEGRYYKCEALADYCGNCRTLQKEYECNWCTNDKKNPIGCHVKNSCTNAVSNVGYGMCEAPIIVDFSPHYGPINGSTNLTIVGQNLGFPKQHVSVNIGQHKCIITDYVSTNKIICTIVKRKATKMQSYHLELIVGDAKIVTKNKYGFVIPTLKSCSPKAGISSGGTIVTLTGDFLDAGQVVKINIVDMHAVVISRTKNKLIFKTTNFDSIGNNDKLQIKIDNFVIENQLQFDVKPLPQFNKLVRGGQVLKCGSYIHFNGVGFVGLQTVRFTGYLIGLSKTENCIVISNTLLRCLSPNIDLLLKGRDLEEINLHKNLSMKYDIQMDSYRMNVINNIIRISLLDNPEIVKFDSDYFELIDSEMLNIKGTFQTEFLTADDYNVTIDGVLCKMYQLQDHLLTCFIVSYESFELNKDYRVEIHLPNIAPYYYGSPGMVRKTKEILRLKPALQNLPKYVIGIVAGGALFLLCIIAFVIVAYRRKSKQNEKDRKNDEAKIVKLEMSVSRECRDAFAELQTAITKQTPEGIVEPPFLSYKESCNKILFPHLIPTNHISMPEYHSAHTMQALDEFERLLCSNTFLLCFIRTLECGENFTMRQRVDVASLISVVLQRHLTYYTDILKILLGDLIKKTVIGQSPKLFLRRTESVAEKMLSNWFTFLLQDFIKETAGAPLYTLFRAIKTQIDQGPVDAITNDAKYSLSEDKLLRQSVEYKTISLDVRDLNNKKHQINILTCDTITQAKEKIIDSIYVKEPYSTWPDVNDIDLDWRTGERGVLTLMDCDITTEKADANSQRKINTMSHYHVTDGALLLLVKKSKSSHSTLSIHSKLQSSNIYSNSSPLLPRAFGGHSTENITMYHILKIKDIEQEQRGGFKMMSEIYLTRLLLTKGILQDFVDKIFEVIYSKNTSQIPKAIKYMFDFLDDQAKLQQIYDNDVVHTWKSNALPLRYWVSIIKNPDFIFDVYKSNIIDSSLSVIAQTFMDSCSLSKQFLSKDSPSNKLLYASEIPKYKNLVESYYKKIQDLETIDNTEMKVYLDNVSKKYQKTFDRNESLIKLYKYASDYMPEILKDLNKDEFAIEKNVILSLEKVRALFND